MGKRDYYDEEKIRKIASIFSITLVLAVVVFLTIFVMYNKKLKSDSSDNLERLGSLNEIVSNDELEEASFSSDKTVENTNFTNTTNTSNVSKTNNETNETNSTRKSRNIVNTTPIQSVVENVANETTNTIDNTVESNENSVQEEKKELSFIAPASGEIIKDFAMDTLVYSNTLEEWTTHSGIDIKADKTSIVIASEAGTIESIKNDPRYGLTITIAHENGFKTIYSNLLTTEFVSEGELVEKGQTIATVGETASFEIADESHLHFEMYKDGQSVNPTIYLKDE